MKIGSNRDINKDHKKLEQMCQMCLKKSDPIQQDPPHNLKVLTKNHNDEKLAITIVIVGACSLAHNFW